jgi:hypothetical protein
MTEMAVTNGKPDERVAARCRELGIKGFAAFARRYGQRITDLSVDRAMEVLDGKAIPPTAHFPDRWAAAIAAPARSKDEQTKSIEELHAMQIDGWLAYLRKKDEENGIHQPTANERDADQDSQHRRDDRPLFGAPLPSRPKRGPRSAR